MFTKGFEERIAEAKRHLQAAQAKQKAYADQKRREVSYAIGDQVLLSTKHINLKAAVPGSKKLMPRWIGPFKFIALPGPVAVKLDLPPTCKIHNVFHVSLVKPYRPDGSVQPPPPEFVDDEPVYKVDSLVKHRPSTYGKKKGYDYLVRWLGYGQEHDMWIPDCCPTA